MGGRVGYRDHQIYLKLLPIIFSLIAQWVLIVVWFKDGTCRFQLILIQLTIGNGLTPGGDLLNVPLVFL